MNRKRKFILFAFTFILSIMLSGYAEYQNVYGASEPQRIIQTYGEAELTAQPDLARLSFTIETYSKSAQEAVKKNAEMTNTVRKTLLDFGLAEKNLKTGSYRLYSYRERPKEISDIKEEQITYQATNEIIVSILQLKIVGEIVDLAVRAGSNNINYISFELKNPQDLMMEALTIAIGQASRKADAIAEGAGETIVKLHGVREERTAYTPFRLQENELQREMAMGVGPTPINPAEVTVRAAVIAEFTF